jgi:hypothetical protein
MSPGESIPPTTLVTVPPSRMLNDESSCAWESTADSLSRFDGDFRYMS